MTHVHTGNEDAYAGKTMTKKKKVSAKIAGIIGVLMLLVSVLGDVVPEIIEQVKEKNHVEQVSEEAAEYNPYEFAKRELSADGEIYEMNLAAGLYKGGVHIPEGRYTISLESGNGTFSVTDSENSIYLSLLFQEGDAEGAVTNAEDVRIYQGAVVKVDGNIVLCCKTENAQMELVQNQNPNTEGKSFDTTFVAGQDIPAGVYDVQCDEGAGIFEYYIPMDGYDSYEGRLLGKDASGFSPELKNIVLPNGVGVKIEGLKVTLTPSEYIESEDYDNFYN